MQIVVICDVLDNFGDAGFCLRISRRLCAEQHTVTLIHNNSEALFTLLGDEPIERLTIVHTESEELPKSLPADVALILHPFGSSEASANISNTIERLKKAYSQSPWFVVDYLSAEQWVEDFHWTQSISPSTGHKSTYVYPGFSRKTGGLIYADWREIEPSTTEIANGFQRIFIFCYTPERISELMKVADQNVHFFSVHALSQVDDTDSTDHTTLAFCPQYQFDERLAAHDFLFIRGEDSFVRAQLSGRPFVWQIYPTVDGAHEEKLTAFFNLYGATLSSEARHAMWSLWLNWNGLDQTESLAKAWNGVQQHHTELASNAMHWRRTLMKGPELVREILTHVSPSTPT